MICRIATVFVLQMVLFGGCAVRPQADSPGCHLAETYVQAANAADAGRIAPMLADDVITVFLEAPPNDRSGIEGKADVIEAIENYTKQCESCRSEVSCLYETDSAVYVTESVTFTDQDGMKQRQSAPLVIEFEDGMIRSIIYYPAD